jgi:hypothetical protein
LTANQAIDGESGDWRRFSMRLATNPASDASRTEPGEREDGVPGVGESLPHHDLAK